MLQPGPGGRHLQLRSFLPYLSQASFRDVKDSAFLSSSHVVSEEQRIHKVTHDRMMHSHDQNVDGEDYVLITGSGKLRPLVI